MTREEEIKLTADKYCLDEYTRLGFVAGAQWADRTMIDKACEWLTRELCYTARGIDPFNDKTATDEFVELFKKYMKED